MVGTYAGTWQGERLRKSSFLTAPRATRLTGRTTGSGDGERVTANGSCRGPLRFGKWGGASWGLWAPYGWANACCGHWEIATILSCLVPGPRAIRMGA